MFTDDIIKQRAMEKLAFSPINSAWDGFYNGFVNGSDSLGNLSFYLGSVLPGDLGKYVRDFGNDMSNLSLDISDKHIQDRNKYEGIDRVTYAAGNMLGNKLISMSPLGFF